MKRPRVRASPPFESKCWRASKILQRYGGEFAQLKNVWAIKWGGCICLKTKTIRMKDCKLKPVYNLQLLAAPYWDPAPTGRGTPCHGSAWCSHPGCLSEPAAGSEPVPYTRPATRMMKAICQGVCTGTGSRARRPGEWRGQPGRTCVHSDCGADIG